MVILFLSVVREFYSTPFVFLTETFKDYRTPSQSGSSQSAPVLERKLILQSYIPIFLQQSVQRRDL